MDEIRKLTNPEFSTISVTNNGNGEYLHEEDEELITIFENETEEYREIVELETLKSDNESFDPSTLDMTQWDSVSADNNKALGFLWETGSQTFKTESGLEITVEKGSDIQVFENKETGEVIVVNADGAKISSNSNDVKLKIYDSEIDEINTGKGNDNIELHNSVVNELDTGKGIDSISIQDSFVDDLNAGSGDDFITTSNSTLENTNTSSTFLWGVFDSSSDTVILDDTNADSIKTGKGADNIIVSNSNVTDLKSGGGDDALSIDETEVTNLSTDKKDTVVKDNNYLDFDKSKIQSIESDVQIQMEDGTTFALTEYTNYILNQDSTFETEEEYQEYTLQTLTENLETMKNIFAQQEDADGILANGYNGLKELTGLGITDEDIKQMIAEQEAMINGLTAALNGESDMTFEEAYEFYTGTSYSKEKLDKYMEVSNVYSAVMIGCQYDEDYADKFKEATGKSVEDVTKEYALCQMETFGKSNSLQKLVDKYAQDQEGFADKLSAVVSGLGITCMVVGAALSFLFPPAGMALLTAGKWISLGGMFVDNAMDLVDDSTDKDGLTKEELGENALETGVEAASYLAGRFIGGGMKGLKLGQTSFSGAFGEFVNGGTNGINSYVTQRLASSGFNAVGSQVLGQVSETSLDMALSLCADYGITQAQSLITTGQFMDSDDYWSVDRFLGEGKNQLMGIFTGLASTKVSLYQQSVMATAQGKILAGDVDGAKTYLHQKGMGMNDTKFNEFVAQIEAVKPTPEITTQDPNNQTNILKANGFSETDIASIVKGGETAYSRAIELAERNVDIGSIKDLSKLSDTQYKKALELIDSGVHPSYAKSIAKLSETEFKNYEKIVSNNISPANAIKLAKLSDTQITRALDLVNKGYPESRVADAAVLSGNQSAKVDTLLEQGVNPYYISQLAALDDSAYKIAMDLINNKGLNAATALDISTKKGSKLTDALEQVELGTYKEIKIELTAEAEAELLKQAELLYANNTPYISKAEAEVAALLGDTGAILTARPKGIQSILNKLITKYEKGKINIGEGSTPETISAECKKAIGDFFGTRIQMQSLSEIKGSVTTALEETGLTFDEFIAHMKNGTIPEGLSKERFNEIKINVAEKLKTQQTDEIVERLVADITAGKIKITELNNYGSEVSSYFTDAQIAQIAAAHYAATGKPLTIVTKLQNGESKGQIYNDDGKLVGEAKTKGAEKDSGYTSTQMNVTHKLDETTTGNGELQIRGTAVNIFGDVEHIPYDIRQGKITAKDVEYSEVYSTIKNMDDASYQKYNEYLAATYEWLRWQELGIETPQPKLEGTFTTKTGEVISPNDMAKLTMEGLTKIAKKTHS